MSASKLVSLAPDLSLPTDLKVAVVRTSKTACVAAMFVMYWVLVGCLELKLIEVGWMLTGHLKWKGQHVGKKVAHDVALGTGDAAAAAAVLG